MVHCGEIIIIGIYPSTGLNGRTLLFYKRGEEPPLEEQFWNVKDNQKVVTR